METPKLRLFSIQDDEMPYFVLAVDLPDALQKWRNKIFADHDLSEMEATEAWPKGIQHVAEPDEIIM